MIVTGIILILIGIILGAFGAHGLKKIVEDQALLDSFETGVRYQIYHGLAFLIFGATAMNQKISKTIFLMFLLGILFFSGSIYALVTFNFQAIDFPKFLVFLTPIGGALLIFSWMLLLIKFLRKS